MNGAHWTETDFIHHLYGIGPDAAHLDQCAGCRARAAEWAARRKASIPDEQVSNEFLAGQRRGIYRRLGREPRPRRRAMLPVLAATFTILLALMLLRPPDKPPTPLVTSAADSELFSEIYAMEERPEPQAILAMQALFEEN